MTDYELIKSEEERLNKEYKSFTNQEKIDFVLRSNLNSVQGDINDLITKIDSKVNDIIILNEEMYLHEYGYITFKQLINLMKIICEKNFKNFKLDNLVDIYSSIKPFKILDYQLDFITLKKEEDYVKMIMHYKCDFSEDGNSHCEELGICKNSKTGLFFLRNINDSFYSSFSAKDEKIIMNAIDCNSIYDYFFKNDSCASIKGFYNNGVNVVVPIDITGSFVVLGEIIDNEYGIGYTYSMVDCDVLKMTHNSDNYNNIEYEKIKSIYESDKNFKDNILININDLPNQYLKYLDTLHTDKNKKGKFIKIKSRFDHKKNS